MASIRKRGDTYQITVSNGRDATGKQILETATFVPDLNRTERQNQKALDRFVIEFEDKVKSGQDMRGQKMNFAELAALFLEDNKPQPDQEQNGLSITTWSEYKRNLEKRIIPHIGHIKIANIVAKTVKDYTNALYQDGARMDGKPGGLSNLTISKDRAIISSVMSYAVGEGLLQINPLIYAGKQSKRSRTKKEYKVRVLTIEQTQAFLWALDHPFTIEYRERQRRSKDGKSYQVEKYSKEWKLSLKWRAYFYLALFIGDRRGENISLTWRDINFAAGEVSISRSTAYADRAIYHKDTKTHRSRTSVIPRVVVQILRQWKAEQMQIALERGTYWEGYHGTEFDKNYLFTQENGRQMHPSSPYHEFKRIIRLYNDFAAPDEAHRIPDDIRPHDLRHTAASILIAHNMDPRSVAGVLGHANPSTTLNIYSYFFQSKSQEAADIMSNALSVKMTNI